MKIFGLPISLADICSIIIWVFFGLLAYRYKLNDQATVVLVSCCVISHMNGFVRGYNKGAQ